jgi:oxygen-independent coproporphyrinogen-3 oxidase
MTSADPRLDEELILRLSGPGPRYTSYPTVPEWRELGDVDARAALARAAERPAEPLSLYVHIPFCARMCLFCGCTVEITRRQEKVASYLEALEREADLVASALGARRSIAQLHWGGGTPTHLSSAELERLFTILAQRFEFLPGAELSLEVHPHVTTCEQIDTLAELGFTRISMGVQDFDAHVQSVIGRDQTIEETERLIEHCRARGLTGVNLDLMYGLPDQDEATFAATLATVARLRPDRLAVYAYAHVPWLKKHQTALEQYHLPTPPERARLFHVALERLAASGYEVIGLDHFALPSDPLWRALQEGTLWRNFMGYTTHPAEEMIALGMSSIGDVGGTFLQNSHETRDYEERLRSGRLATVRGLVRSAEDELRRAVIQEIMCRMRLDLEALGQRFGRPDLERHFAREWRELGPLAELGLCNLGGAALEVTPRGRLFLRHIAMVFDQYLHRQAKDERRFSKTL